MTSASRRREEERQLPRERVATALGVCAAAMAVLWAVLDLDLGSKEQRALALSARRATEVAAAIGSSSAVTTLQLGTLRDATVEELRGVAREYVALDAAAAAPYQEVRGRAETAAEADLTAVAERLSQPPGTDDGVDHAERRLLTATPETWQRLVSEQGQLVDEAERLGERGRYIVWAIALASVASALFGVVANLRTAATARAFLLIGGLLLLLSLGVGLEGATA